MNNRKRDFFQLIRPYLYILPMVIIFGTFSMYPLIRTFVLSFMETNVIGTDLHFIGLENFRTMAKDRYIWRIVGNTFLFSFFSVTCSIVLGLFFAAIANARTIRFRGLMRIATFYPYILPSTVAAMVWIYMYNPARGVINTLLTTRIQWLNSPKYALMAVIIVHIWKSLGFNFLLILSGMQNISPELYEAAALETNSEVKRFFSITLPLIKPTLFLVVLLSITSSFQSMDLVSIMTDGGPSNSSNVLAYYVYQQGIINHRIGYASAVSSLVLIMLLIFTVFYTRSEKRNVDYESE